MRFSKAIKAGAGLVRLADGSLLSVADLSPGEATQRGGWPHANWQWCAPYFINYSRKKSFLKPTASAKKNFVIGCATWRPMALWFKNNVAQQYFTLELSLLRYGNEWLTFMVNPW